MDGNKLKFVHMPTERTFLLPIGMIALANLVKEHGFDVEIIHYGLDQPDLSNEELLLFDLHWHDQAAIVIDKILELKIKTIIGGHTASCFAEEIESLYPVTVIKGESERELLYILTEKNINIDINELDYSSFNVLRSYDEYLKKGFYFSTGRGCSVDCSYCSGGKTMQKKIFCRDNFEFLKQEKVCYEVKNAMKYGAKKWNLSFDPSPNGDYYLKLFDIIDFDIEVNFDCWGLPTKAFIDKFSETFSKSKISISPKTCLNDIRRRNKGMYFSNKELVEIVDYIDKKKINLELWFVEMEEIDLIKRLGENRCFKSTIISEPFKINKFNTYYHIHKLKLINSLKTKLI